MEVYGDKSLTDDPHERGPALMDLLRAMQFPVLDCDPMLGDLIHKCWHNQFPIIASLAVATNALLNRRYSGEESKTVKEGINVKLATDGGESDANSPTGIEAGNRTGNVASKKALCRELEERGLFGFLRLKNPC
jgi:hypothetical protein